MSNTDILCIVPPFSYGNYADIGPKCPNLGIATIAAYLEANDFRVKIIDAFALDLTVPQILEEVKKIQPSMVFVGSVTSTHPASLEIMRNVKEHDPSMTTIIGGPHVTNVPESAFPGADYVVIGEGEETSLELAQLVTGKKSLKKHLIKGLAYLDKGALKITEKRPFITDMDSLPIPAYHLLPMDAYKAYGWLDVGRKFTTMITSRGCPFKCSFCASSKNFEHLWRYRSASKIFEEMKLLYEKYNIRHIYFQDDEFCVHPGRVKELCNKLIESKMDMYWECLTRVVSAQEDMFSLMSKAGCKSVLFGVEVGYEEGWKKIGKPVTKELNLRAVRMAQKHHIMVKASFVTGFPWEGVAEIKQTIKFAKELDPDIVFFTTLNPFPGTYIWNQYFKDDTSLFANGYDLNAFIIHGANPVIRTKHLSAEDLEYWNGRAYLEFYLRPKYILRKLRSMRNLHELKRNFSSGKSLIKLAVKRVLTKKKQPA